MIPIENIFHIDYQVILIPDGTIISAISAGNSGQLDAGSTGSIFLLPAMQRIWRISTLDF